jgi:hypothetical protein
MTCIVLHNGYVVADSKVRHPSGADLSGLADLAKIQGFTKNLSVRSVREGFEATVLGAVFTGSRNVFQVFLAFLVKGIPLDNTVDHFAEIRSLGLSNPDNNTTVALICTDRYVIVELNYENESVSWFAHGNYAPDQPPPKVYMMGSGATTLGTVTDVYCTAQGYRTAKEMRAHGRRVNPLTLALACAARDDDSGGTFSLWRVVNESEEGPRLKFFGVRDDDVEDMFLARDLTEFIPLHLWNRGGEIPYDPIPYPDVPTKETPDVQATAEALPEDGQRRPAGPQPRKRRNLSGGGPDVAGKRRKRRGEGDAGGGQHPG